MVESNSSCLETYKITFQSCLYFVWLRRYDKKLILVAILDFFFFSKCSKVRTPYPWVSLYTCWRWIINKEKTISGKKWLCKKVPFGCRTSSRCWHYALPCDTISISKSEWADINIDYGINVWWELMQCVDMIRIILGVLISEDGAK